LTGLIVYPAPPVDPNACNAGAGWQEVSVDQCPDVFYLFSSRPVAFTPNHSFDIVRATRFSNMTCAMNPVVGVAQNAPSSIQNMVNNA
jgi:hypothetical protein